MHPCSALQSIREDRGHSLREVAGKSEYSPSYIADIKSGRRRPRFFALECILMVLGAPDKKHEILAGYREAKIRAVC
jgi:transcriptional regulator with XRE-family HTH domain